MDLYVVIPATQRSSHLQCKGTTFVFQLFIEDLESGTVPGIEPAIVSKASKRLHIIRVLRRGGVSAADLLVIYVALVRPVLEYCCVV